MHYAVQALWTMQPRFQIAQCMLDTEVPNIMLATSTNVKSVSKQVQCLIMLQVIKLVGKQSNENEGKKLYFDGDWMITKNI